MAKLTAEEECELAQAILDADTTLFLIDARAGVTPLDKSFATMLRRAGKPVILVANKVEGRKGDEGLYEAYSMGFGEPVPISAEHGEGMADLRDALESGRLKKLELESGGERNFHMYAIFGKGERTGPATRLFVELLQQSCAQCTDLRR